MRDPLLIKYLNDGNWEGVDTHSYKEDDSPFKGILRRTLFEGDDKLPCQVRYFEVEADGYSTLERHEHAHLVLILNGKGSALVGSEVLSLAEKDMLLIPGGAWHQFRADKGITLGFICIVNIERDRPALPTSNDLEEMGRDPAIAAFLQMGAGI
jgi:quercetin dioxygenase-like cupin family protein